MMVLSNAQSHRKSGRVKGISRPGNAEKGSVPPIYCYKVEVNRSLIEMLASNRQCRRNVMGKEEDDKLRTIDCLRGRLLAERMASRTAKEEAHKLAKRLQELERKLAEEIKCRDRAQKKLKYAMKKLESMKAFDGLRDQMDKPMSFVGSSSSQCCLGRQTFEGETAGSLTVDSGQGGLSEDVKILLSSSGSQGIPETSPEESAHQLVFLEESWTSAKKVKSQCEVPETVEKDKGFSPEEWEICHLRQESSAQDCESENNVLALVPTGKSLDPEVDNPEVEDNVESVLLSLRKVKEQLIQSLKLTAGVYSSKMHFC